MKSRVGRQVCSLSLLLVALAATGSMAAQQVRSGVPPRQTGIIEPLELIGPGKQMAPPPTAAQRQFAESKALQSLNPKDASTLAPALRELTMLIQQEPNNSDAHLLRAEVLCESRADTKSILNEIIMSLSTRISSKSSAYDTLKGHYALMAKVEFDSGQSQNAMNDLETAIRQNYEDAEQVFNDGNVKPTTVTQPCVWTQPDLESLAQKFPTDYRPHLYRGLYLSYFGLYSDVDYQPILKEFDRAATLNPASPLPHYFRDL